MTDLDLRIDADPRQWVEIPARYPDGRGSTPRRWARSVAGEHRGADDDLQRALLTVARRERHRQAGRAFALLPQDGVPGTVVRVRAVPTDEVDDHLPPTSKDEPVEDVHHARSLGPARRRILTSWDDHRRGDRPVMVIYEWTLGASTVLLTWSSGLGRSAARRMLRHMDAFADAMSVVDDSGAAVSAHLSGHTPSSRRAEDESGSSGPGRRGPEGNRAPGGTWSFLTLVTAVFGLGPAAVVTGAVACLRERPLAWWATLGLMLGAAQSVLLVAAVVLAVVAD